MFADAFGESFAEVAEQHPLLAEGEGESASWDLDIQLDPELEGAVVGDVFEAIVGDGASGVAARRRNEREIVWVDLLKDGVFGVGGSGGGCGRERGCCVGGSGGGVRVGVFFSFGSGGFFGGSAQFFEFVSAIKEGPQGLAGVAVGVEHEGVEGVEIEAAGVFFGESGIVFEAVERKQIVPIIGVHVLILGVDVGRWIVVWIVEVGGEIEIGFVLCFVVIGIEGGRTAQRGIGGQKRAADLTGGEIFGDIVAVSAERVEIRVFFLWSLGVVAFCEKSRIVGICEKIRIVGICEKIRIVGICEKIRVVVVLGKVEGFFVVVGGAIEILFFEGVWARARLVVFGRIEGMRFGWFKRGEGKGRCGVGWRDAIELCGLFVFVDELGFFEQLCVGVARFVEPRAFGERCLGLEFGGRSRSAEGICFDPFPRELDLDAWIGGFFGLMDLLLGDARGLQRRRRFWGSL